MIPENIRSSCLISSSKMTPGSQPRAILEELTRQPRNAPTRLFVRRTDCDVDFFIANFAQDVSLEDIAAEFTGRAAVENAYFAAVIIILIQLRVDHVARRILLIYRRDVCFLYVRDAQGREVDQ